MIVRRRSLRHRLTAFYVAIIAIALSTAGVAVVVVLFSFVTRPIIIALNQAARNVSVIVAGASPALSTSELLERIVRAQHDDAIDVIPIPPNAARDAPVTPPPGEFSVPALLGFYPQFISVRNAAIVLVPVPGRVAYIVRAFAIAVLLVIIVALGIARLIAGVLARQALAPLKTVTAELERFAAGDFTPRPLSIEDATELGELTAAYNGASRQVSDAFLERRRVEEQFRQFVAEAGHELRTPLTVVAGYVDVLRRWGETDERIRSNAFTSLGVELKRMRMLVERLMTLARLDGPVESEPEGIAVSEIVRQVVDALSVMSGSVRIDLEILADAVVLGQPGDLYEATSNLVENALKYGAQTPVLVRLSSEQSGIVIRVSDGGPGIAEMHRSRIFERFYRASADAKVGGSGLGLAIAARAAQRLGGCLDLEHASRGSTVFALRLPVESVRLRAAAFSEGAHSGP